MKANRTARPTAYTEADKVRAGMSGNGRVYGPGFCRCGCGTPKAHKPRSVFTLGNILSAMGAILVSVAIARSLIP